MQVREIAAAEVAETAVPARADVLLRADVPGAGVPGGPSRLAAARAALAQAEARTGLRAPLPAGPRTAAAVGASRPAPGTLAAATATALPVLPSPAPGTLERVPESPGPWEAVSPDATGALSLTGSMTLLLAAAARRQGARGWCAVVGGEDLGWCAAAEAGLDLSRVLVVPARDLASAALPAVVTALVDGLDVVLLTDGTARLLTARQQRTVTARARERGCLVLLDEPWEGARLLWARPRGVGTRLEDAGQAGREPDDVPQAGGARVLPLRPMTHSPGQGDPPAPPPARSLAPEDAMAPVEAPAGYLRHLDWELTE
ncbi:hypothetical protein, partial [Actinomyces sp. 217892]